MTPAYLEVVLACNSLEEQELAIAALWEAGIESLTQEDNGTIKANFIDEPDIKERTGVSLQNFGLDPSRLEWRIVPFQNWNETWEKEYPIVIIGNEARIRAPFHQVDDFYPMDIIVSPQMSFGTGHHATTRLVLQSMLKCELHGASVIDIGTGTGVLAIGAKKMGANHVTATDIDENCISNTLSNWDLNFTERKLQTQVGPLHYMNLNETSFNFVLANLTRNTILDNLSIIAKMLSSGGTLIASGFMEKDIPILNERASIHGLILSNSIFEDSWAALTYIKN